MPFNILRSHPDSANSEEIPISESARASDAIQTPQHLGTRSIVWPLNGADSKAHPATGPAPPVAAYTRPVRSAAASMRIGESPAGSDTAEGYRVRSWPRLGHVA